MSSSGNHRRHQHAPDDEYSSAQTNPSASEYGNILTDGMQNVTVVYQTDHDVVLYKPRKTSSRKKKKTKQKKRKMERIVR